MSFKLKKLSVILISAIILIAIIIVAILFFKKDNDIKDVNTSTSEITESYNDNENNKKESTTDFHEGVLAERERMLNLPDDVLSNMSTDDLIEKVLEYPFHSDGLLSISSNPAQAMAEFDLSYSCFRELSQRSDACEILMEKYKNEPLPLAANNPDANAENMDSKRLSNMEFLLSKDFIIQTLDKSKIKELSEIVFEKYELSKNPPEGYSSRGYGGVLLKLNLRYNNIDELESLFIDIHDSNYTAN